MKEKHKALLRRHFEELWNSGDLLVADEIYAPDYVRHSPLFGEVTGPESEKELVVLFRTAFSNLNVTVETLLAEGNWVAACWMLCGKDTGGFQGNLPTGLDVQVRGIRLVRIVNNQIVESWEQSDLPQLQIKLEAERVAKVD